MRLNPFRPRRFGALGDPWSTPGPNTGTLAVSSGSSIAAYYNRQSITLTIDPAAGSGVVYGLCAGTGTPSATNFHFALGAALPPWVSQYSGPIQLAASTGTIRVGVLEA